MNKVDERFKEDIRNILENGFMDENPRPKYADGSKAYTKSVNHVVRTYDLSNGFIPIITLRAIAYKHAIRELFWIYQQQSNDLNLLRDTYKINYWNEWESKDIPSTIGIRYGATVKKYDLMNKLLQGLKDDPFGRRHIIDLYQYADFEESDGLYPCAFCTIWNVRRENGELTLDLLLVQRSGDLCCASSCGGINEVQYAVFQHLVARHCGYNVGKFTHIVVNEQIYDRHEDNAKIMLERESIDCFPQIKFNTNETNFFQINPDDIEIVGYPVDQIKEKNPQLKFELGI